MTLYKDIIVIENSNASLAFIELQKVKAVYNIRVFEIDSINKISVSLFEPICYVLTASKVDLDAVYLKIKNSETKVIILDKDLSYYSKFKSISTLISCSKLNKSYVISYCKNLKEEYNLNISDSELDTFYLSLKPLFSSIESSIILNAIPLLIISNAQIDSILVSEIKKYKIINDLTDGFYDYLRHPSNIEYFKIIDAFLSLDPSYRISSLNLVSFTFIKAKFLKDSPDLSYCEKSSLRYKDINKTLIIRYNLKLSELNTLFLEKPLIAIQKFLNNLSI